MPISTQIRKNWVATQKKFDFPVNAIGVKIDPKTPRPCKSGVTRNIDEDGRFAALLKAPPTPPEEAKTNTKKSSGEVLTYRGVPIQ